MESEENTCPLTARQFQVLSLATFANKEIGAALGISQQTVKNHFINIRLQLSLYAKHSVLGRTSQLIYAIKQEWIALGDVECWRGQCSLEEDR